MFIMVNQNHTYNIPKVKTTIVGQYCKVPSIGDLKNFKRTQNLNLLNLNLLHLKKPCSRNMLPNTTVTPKAIYHLLFIATFYVFSCP